MYSCMKFPDDIQNSFEIMARLRMSGTDGKAMAYDTSCFLRRKNGCIRLPKTKEVDALTKNPHLFMKWHLITAPMPINKAVIWYEGLRGGTRNFVFLKFLLLFNLVDMTPHLKTLTENTLISMKIIQF